MNKEKKKAVGGLIFGLGLIAVLVGAMTDVYTTEIGALIMLAIWFIGGALAKIVIK